ncbi:SixA phosphatase family protein [Pseudomarimonas salicorniae]|uniref:Histidine phosphatase family protein n=1 Tax=Pseudomarimonas salicorniae TaxID=2933270 RepID=A0ABT0GDU8_9GAMM|nr:histidine phosphatase family protein [Lysobacter sp. CAU 1642]MCK7592334.1 histidine phosphatase family protein [Lysobacter sp. CAU 1642]
MSQPLRVTLLRHAHAEPALSGQSDLERPLSSTGEAEADDAAVWLAARGAPARVLCSPAARARQTLSRVLDKLGFVDTREEAEIYEASPGTLMALIERHRDAGSLLLVGHNPGFESVVALLATGQSGDHRGMPPAGIAELELPDGGPVEPGCARMVAFWWP